MVDRRPMKAPEPAARSFRIQGLPLRIWDHGGEGRPLLFLHGFLDTGRSFDEAVRALGPAWRGLCLDWRGHGGSRPVPEGASFHQLDHLKDLTLLLDRLEEEGLAPFALVGHSLGGIVACLLAGSLPGRVQRLILVDSLGAVAEEPGEGPARLGAVLERLRQGPRPFRTFASPEAAARRVRENNPGLTEEGARRMVRSILERTEDGRYAFPFDPRLRGPSPVRWPESFWRRLLGRIEARVHVLQAEYGYADRLPDAEGRFRALRRGSRRLLEGVGHHAHLDAPGLLARAMAAFLEEEAS